MDMRVTSTVLILASCSVLVEGCGDRPKDDWPMLAFVLRPAAPPANVSPDYDLGARVSREGVQLGKFAWSGGEVNASCTEFSNALVVRIAHSFRSRPPPKYGELHCRVLDSTGRPLHFVGVHPAFFYGVGNSLGTLQCLGLVFSKRRRELAQARIIVTTDKGESEMVYQPVRRTPNPWTESGAAGDPEGREP